MAVPKINLQSYTQKSTYDPAKQVAGYKKRIAATGLDVEKETDTRNFLERGLNLTPDQNALFDFFEILERPQQAIFNAVRASQKGENVGEALKKGITGKDVVRFKEILQAEGMEDSGEKIGADDIAGFLGDVFLDPMDIALLPVAAAAKGAKAVVKGADAAVDVAQAAKAGTRLASGSELVMKGLQKGVKGIAKVSDLGVTKLLTKLDAIDEAKDVAKGLRLAEGYHNIKKVITGTFDAAKNLPKGMMDKIRRVLGNSDYTVDSLKVLKDDIVGKIDDLAKTRKLASETVEQASERVGKDILDFNEFNDYKPETTLETLIQKQDMDKIPVTSDVASQLDGINKKFKMGYKESDMFTREVHDGVEYVYMNKGFQEDFLKQYEDLIKSDLSVDDFIKEKNKVDTNPALKNRYSGESYADSQHEVEKVRQSIPDQDAINAEVAEKHGSEFVATADDLETNRGGTVINGKIIDTNEGYNVAWDKKQEVLVDSAQEVIDYAKKNNLKSYGFWRNDEGKYAIDVTSTYTKDPNIAYQLGYFGDQDSIWDWSAHDTIDTDKFGPVKKLTIAKIPDTRTVKEAIEEVSKKSILAPRFYSAADRKRFADLAADPEFAALAADSKNVNQKMREFIDLGSSDVDEMGNIIPDTATTRFGGEDAGVYRHAASDQYKGLTKKIRDSGSEQAGMSSFRTNVNAFSGREYKMSTLEANRVAQEHQIKLVTNGTPAQKEFWSEHDNIQLFKETIQSSMEDFIDQAPKFAKNTNMIDTVLVHGWMEDPDIIKGITREAKAPIGYHKVPKSALTNKLNALSKYVSPASEKAFKDTIKRLPATDDLLIDSNVFDMVGRLDDAGSTNLLVNILDKANNAFKKFKLMSPGFQMRNMLGNYTNLYLAGVPIDQVARNYAKADTIMKTGEELIKKVTLDPTAYSKFSELEKESYRVYTKFIRNNFSDIADEVWEIPASVTDPKKRDLLTQVQQFNNKLNKDADKRYRMAGMMYAEANPQVYQKLGLGSDVEFVRHTLFDPKDLSAAEKNIGKRLIPFYTFTKKNLAFQMKNIVDNPVKYKNIKKGIEDLWSAQGIDTKDIDTYKRENFWIPVFTKKNGEYVALKSNLPIGDLGEFLQDPLAKVTSAITPLARVPFELATNTQTYTGLPIQEFKGQKGYNMPGLSRKGEYLLGQTGLDVPIMGVSDVLKAGKGLVSGQMTGGQALQTAVGRSVMSSGSTAKAATSKAYTELDQMQQLMRYYKQQEVDILTIAEAENQNINLNAVTAAIARLRQ